MKEQLVAMPTESSARSETLTDTLIERVDKLVQASKEPLLSTTPTSVAISELGLRIEALEKAVREIALEVQRTSGDASEGLARGSRD
jgi:predicted sugar kinase